MLALIFSAGFTAWITAGLGLGGGVLLLGIMSFLLPTPVVIALHGVVQIGANVGRTVLMHRFIDRHIIWPFLLGCILGAVLGGQLLLQIPSHILDITLGLFILYATWGAWPALRKSTLWFSSVLISLISMFVGATGPLVAAALKAQALDRQAHVATFSALMSLQHGIKVLVFGALGFQFGPWLGLLSAMLIAGFAGTWLGQRWLAKRQDHDFQRVLGWLLTLLAAQLLWRGFSSLL
jgi:uncharacterized membrane protein YfcA